MRQVAAAPSPRSPCRERMCVDNNLEGRDYGRTCTPAANAIRDGVEDKEARRGLGSRAAASSNYGLIPRAGLKVERRTADGIKRRYNTGAGFERALHHDHIRELGGDIHIR